jgi:hypothetical protein
MTGTESRHQMERPRRDKPLGTDVFIIACN